MLDLEGNELEVGTIYIIPGTSNILCVGRYHHETKNSLIFHPLKAKLLGSSLYTWKRSIYKTNLKYINAYKASQELIDNFQLY